MNKFKNKKENYFKIISIGLFLVSLSQKTYCVDFECGDYGAGLHCLFMGALGVFFGGAFLSWLANPLLFISWLSFKNKIKTSMISSLLALSIGLYFLSFDEIMVNEAGQYKTITDYKLGYWLWILSMVILLIGNIFRIMKTNINLKEST